MLGCEVMEIFISCLSQFALGEKVVMKKKLKRRVRQKIAS